MADVYQQQPESQFQLPDILTATPDELILLRKLALGRFDYFTSAVLGYLVTPFHARMMDHQLSTDNSMVLAPRGSGKSTVCDVAYLLWRIIKNPNLRICIASKSGPQAQSFLSEIKQHIENNERFRRLFGDLVGTKTWNETEITVSTRTKILKEPTICTKSVGAGIPGFHFDIIVADDLVDMENSATELQRKKMNHWFYVVLLPTLEPDTGELRVIGTRYHPQDIYGHFAFCDSRTGEYRDDMLGPNVLVIPALTFTPAEYDEDGNQIKEPQPVSFWPEKFTIEFLLKKRKNGMLFFNLAYQNDATIQEGGIIKVEDLEPYVWVTESDHPPLHELAIFQGADPAISLRQRADDFAHATIGVGGPGGKHVWVLKLIVGKYTVRQQVNLMIAEYRLWQPELVGIETIAYQDALRQLVEEEIPFFPVLSVKPRKDKEQRARLLSPITENHQLHLRYDMFDAMECLIQMPTPSSGHDDYFDGIDLAVEAARQHVLNDSVVGILPTNLRKR